LTSKQNGVYSDVAMLNPYQKSNLKVKGFQDPDRPKKKPPIILTYEYVVSDQNRMKVSGRATTTLCPFHADTNPSFALYEDTDSAHCFSCGWDGDSWDLIQKILDFTFKEAVEFAEDHELI
jgi:hypothetical protein